MLPIQNPSTLNPKPLDLQPPPMRGLGLGGEGFTVSPQFTFRGFRVLGLFRLVSGYLGFKKKGPQHLAALQRVAVPATSRRCNVLVPSATACRWRGVGSAEALQRCGVVVHRCTLRRCLSGQLRGVRVSEQRCGAAAW